MEVRRICYIYIITELTPHVKPLPNSNLLTGLLAHFYAAQPRNPALSKTLVAELLAKRPRPTEKELQP
jgi:hypothetical protein